MSGFSVHRVIKTLDDKIVSEETYTTCNVCNARLESAQEWSRHRSMHTTITERDLQCHIPMSGTDFPIALGG